MLLLYFWSQLKCAVIAAREFLPLMELANKRADLNDCIIPWDTLCVRNDDSMLMIVALTLAV